MLRYNHDRNWKRLFCIRNILQFDKYPSPMKQTNQFRVTLQWHQDTRRRHNMNFTHTEVRVEDVSIVIG